MHHPGWLGTARSRLRAELCIVLFLTLIPAALFAISELVELALAPVPLADTETALNPAQADSAVFDTVNRTIRFLAGLAPVALVVLLLTTRHRSGFNRLGLTPRRGDTLRVVALASAVGIPGLALYAASRLGGFTVQVVAGDATFQWHTVAGLLLAAVRAALVEEVVLLGYLGHRLTALRWRPWQIILLAALLRGSYHLYQGIPMALGNVAMGALFGAAFFTIARRRVLPFVLAHFTLDAVAFIGYPLAVALWPGIF